MLYQRIKTLFYALLMVPFAQAAELQTDWIRPVEGQREETLGASVQTVETIESGESRVTIAIPKPSLAGAEDIQEIVIVGQEPDKSEKRLEIRHEWVADYDNDNYGLVLYLGKRGDVPLRLYLKSPD